MSVIHTIEIVFRKLTFTKRKRASIELGTMAHLLDIENVVSALDVIRGNLAD